MAYTPHTRITWGGLLGGPSVNQDWSIGLRVSIEPTAWAGIVALDPTALTTYAIGCLDDFTTSWPGSEFGKDRWLTYAKVALIDAAGHYTAPPTIAPGSLSAAYGTDNTLLPYQVCLVGSMKHVGIGRGNFGRVYYPTVASLPLVGGKISDTARGDYHGRHQAFLQAVNTRADATLSGACINIYNRATGSVKKVDQAAVGRVLDTQRRRRDQLDETLDFLPI